MKTQETTQPGGEKALIEQIAGLQKQLDESKKEQHGDHKWETWGTHNSFLGTRPEPPKTKAEMAVEFFEIFEDQFLTYMEESALENRATFDLPCTDARDYLSNDREYVGRLFQDFIFAQYNRGQVTGADPLVGIEAENVINFLERLAEYLRRTEKLYTQIWRRMKR